MKFMLMMHCPKKGYESFGAWPKEDIQAHIAFMKRINAEMREAGQLVSAEGLDDPQRAKLVRAGKNGVPITDGPFAETKEFLAGFWIVKVADAEEAYRIAAKISAAPGPGGTLMSMPVEVRQVLAGPPKEFE